eukprot:scaffold4101_cov267-Pinguiococcus_pyrenoidosus.AAC.2
MLSETKQELSGELALYPGSHRVLSKYFEEEGGASFVSSRRVSSLHKTLTLCEPLCSSFAAFDLALSEGMAGLRRHINAHRPLGPPVHILGKPGNRDLEPKLTS